MIRLSKARKMPCRSWSLLAIDTCPASIGSDGELVDACKGCYATIGNYNFPNVKAPRIHNKEDWRRDGWVQDMIEELDNDRYFRWLDSGDVYHIRLAEKILEVCKATPWTRHWLPTRMHKFKKFRKILNELKKMCNLHNKKYYSKYKKQCDEYFYLTHRKESRGIGGIFFDYKMDNWKKDFLFIKDVGNVFTYLIKENQVVV